MLTTLRVPTHLLRLAVALWLPLAACSRAADSVQPLAPAARADAGGPGDTGNANGGASISARVLVNKLGHAIIDVSTAPFPNGSAMPAPNGLLRQVHYKLIDPTGKQRYEESVKLESPAATLKDTIPPTLKRQDKGSRIYPPIPLTPEWTVVVQAAVVGYVDPACVTLASRDKDERCKQGRVDVVRVGPLPIAYNPDLDLGIGGDLNARPINRSIMPANPRAGATADIVPFTQVAKDSLLDYVITITNNGPRNNSTVGVLATCSVLLDGAPVAEVYWEDQGGLLPNASTVPLYIPPNTARICHWRARVTSTGDHSFTATANAIDPLDYDPSNNSVSQEFEVVDYVPPSARLGENPLGVTVSEIAWFDALGALLQMSTQSTTLNNFPLPEQTAAAAAATSSYAISMIVTTGNTIAGKNIVDGAVLSSVYWTGMAPAGCTEVTPETVVNRNQAAVTLTLCLTPGETPGGVVASVKYQRVAGPTPLAPSDILLYGKYVKAEMRVTRVVAGLPVAFGGVTRLMPDVRTLYAVDFQRQSPPPGAFKLTKTGPGSAPW